MLPVSSKLRSAIAECPRPKVTERDPDAGQNVVGSRHLNGKLNSKIPLRVRVYCGCSAADVRRRTGTAWREGGKAAYEFALTDQHRLRRNLGPEREHWRAWCPRRESWIGLYSACETGAKYHGGHAIDATSGGRNGFWHPAASVRQPKLNFMTFISLKYWFVWIHFI